MNEPDTGRCLICKIRIAAGSMCFDCRDTGMTRKELADLQSAGVNAEKNINTDSIRGKQSELRQFGR